VNSLLLPLHFHTEYLITDPLTAIGGNYASLFSWTYNSGTYTGIQTGTIPDESSGNITISYRVTRILLLLILRTDSELFLPLLTTREKNNEMMMMLQVIIHGLKSETMEMLQPVTALLII
jgi:hypothetical protein